MKRVAPLVMVVDDDEPRLRRTVAELQRYEKHYRIVPERSASGALRCLGALATAGDDVALVLAEHWLPDLPGTELLARVGEVHPRARRGLMIEWGDRTALPAMRQAWALGRMDFSLAPPVTSPDERFHRAVTEFLDEWWRVKGTGFEVVRVIGEASSPRGHEMRDILTRLDIPHGSYPPESVEGRAALAQSGAASGPLPVLILRNGRALCDPTNREVAEAFGVMVSPTADIYDVTIVGGGPAGLAAAVYAGSEGLRTALLEREALGGQAGTSSMIKNYLGFPRGIRGADLAARATNQVVMFGADVIYTNTACSLRSEGGLRIVGLSDGSEAVSRCVVLATGVSYRRLAGPGIDELLGAGVFYGAATAEAQDLAGERVFVVGGGNSAGQAALHLARYAEKVTILVRSESVADSMSEYLVDEIAGCPNVEVRHRAGVAAATGKGRLEALHIEDLRSGDVETVSAAALFVLIGGEPRTAWLPPSVARDGWGYVLTGSAASSAPGDRAASLLETSLPGVFAVGDVRAGSVKRVAAAVGEGSICIRLVHEYLTAAGVGVRMSTL